MTQDPIKLADG